MGRVLTRAPTRLILVAAGAAATLAAWWWLADAAALHPHAPATSIGTFAAAVVMWQAMMVAMMTPSVAPWVGLYARLAGDGPARGAMFASVAFAGGYFAIWFGYSVAAALLHLLLAAVGLFGPDGPSPLVAGVILIGAGAFQFAPVKQACLRHCRNPMSYLLARWGGGPPGAFGLGLRHGAYCVGCCWLLMLTGFAVGLMNLAWMAGLTLLVAVEQIAPGGAWLGRIAGGALIAWGAVLASAA